VKSPADVNTILDALEGQHPGADTELHYTNAFELLIATILSAQSTDAGVNKATPGLFKKYPDARALAKAKCPTLEKLIHSTGFYRAKAKTIVKAARILVDEHDGEVPAEMDALVELPGVGRKTANVVLGHAFKIPGLPVDRHVLRVANRLGIAESDDPIVVEQQLCGTLAPERWTRASDTLILHGRRICRPKPMCDDCAARDECDYFRTVIALERNPEPARTARPARSARKKGARAPRRVRATRR